ncbi:non-structural maintenance of chromosomes element 4 homolog A [Callorhinchus milii]|nr:non-structural maintenance of chromosomes element 4 homolog A [Callorhinchus milii]|eukprot:gi/632971288/ref/XP_007902098.1/ PREDICTED: non-structural maintenance of chromosomes element 4 homolog A-like [Callorhinchus milii]
MSESRSRGRSLQQPPSPPTSSCTSNSVAARGRTNSIVSECTEDEEGSDAIMYGARDDDPSGRRVLRLQYRELINTVQQNREDMIRPSSNKLTEALEEANKLFSNVRQTREAALDAQFLVLATNLGQEKANQLHTDMMVFDPSVFTEQLLTFMGLNRLEAGESDEDEAAGWLPKDAWTKLGKETEKYLKRAPTFHYMLGSFKAEPPAPRQKIERQKRVPNQEERRIMPTQLKKMDECHQEATEKEVERILGLLQQYFKAEPETPINFFDFVIDPHSFPRTVENIFHVSFIVRDGFAALKLDQDKLPIIEPVSESMDNDGPQHQRQQMVISLSPQEWRDIIDTFEITEAMIPGIQHKE